MNPSNVPANVPEADQVADTLAREWREAEAALRMTKERMTDTKGTIPEYSVGKKVWLDGKNVELRNKLQQARPKTSRTVRGHREDLQSRVPPQATGNSEDS
ncbi:hypothetical protein RHS01_03563 [Rhizoctonia solani]|uniref:Uncharacterized protein n=1 Tax=Rhizoctonia solani TaxID=456999 RepID=A0A8H7M751_9AGAM|nr:hypothetical protein RHS01_03563 [Rhizoctonia solani]